MKDLFKVVKGRDFISVIVLLLFIILLEYFSQLEVSDYILIVTVYALLFLHVMSTRLYTERFNAIEQRDRQREERCISDRRITVLTKIGACNTLADFNIYRLRQLLDTYGEKIDRSESDNINNLIEKLDDQLDTLADMSDSYGDTNHQFTLEKMDRDYAYLMNAEKDSLSIAKIIESGFDSLVM